MWYGGGKRDYHRCWRKDGQKEGSDILLEFHDLETQTVVELHMDKQGNRSPDDILLLPDHASHDPRSDPAAPRRSCSNYYCKAQAVMQCGMACLCTTLLLHLACLAKRHGKSLACLSRIHEVLAILCSSTA